MDEWLKEIFERQTSKDSYMNQFIHGNGALFPLYLDLFTFAVAAENVTPPAVYEAKIFRISLVHSCFLKKINIEGQNSRSVDKKLNNNRDNVRQLNAPRSHFCRNVLCQRLRTLFKIHLCILERY